jgi:hypothetical protein
MADEYKDSHNWLQSGEEPEFDDAALNAFKAGVLRRLSENSAKPSLMSALMQHWSRRQIFALAAAALIIFGMVVLYVSQSRARISVPVPKRAESNPTEQPGLPDVQPPEVRKDTDRVVGSRRPGHRSHRSISLARNSGRAHARHAANQTGMQTSVARARGPIMNSTANFGGSPALLRIEFQTSDPNIRIIWFAPKETDSNQSKPATD